MTLDNIIIPNPQKIKEAKLKISQAGKERLMVVSDFDKTLTSCFVGGKKIASLISILRDEKYLTPDYPERAQALYAQYHPIEIDLNISKKNKVEAMHEWWSRHYELLVASGLTRSDLKKVSESEKIALRSGASEFLDFLSARRIPLLILSSAGMGSETIALFLERFKKLTDNVHIASNSFLWDKDKVVGVAEPLIHAFNKDFTAVKQFAFYDQLKSRRNVILLGDGLGDAEMLNGFDYDTVIKIGFLNETSKGELASFKKEYDIIILNDGSMDTVVDVFKRAFDVVILNDGPMDFVNILIRELVGNVK